MDAAKPLPLIVAEAGQVIICPFTDPDEPIRIMAIPYGPETGRWPVESGLGPSPPILKSRIWIDGCFDFSHHGEL